MVWLGYHGYRKIAIVIIKLLFCQRTHFRHSVLDARCSAFRHFGKQMYGRKLNGKTRYRKRTNYQNEYRIHLSDVGNWPKGNRFCLIMTHMAQVCIFNVQWTYTLNNIRNPPYFIILFYVYLLPFALYRIWTEIEQKTDQNWTTNDSIPNDICTFRDFETQINKMIAPCIMNFNMNCRYIHSFIC